MQNFDDEPTFFLSRLCGGESKLFHNLILLLFLSRLCGGELVLVFSVFIAIFLSRLCGGEFTLERLSV